MEVNIVANGRVLTLNARSTFRDASYNIQFHNIGQMFGAYNKLKKLGIKCKAIGRDAIHGSHIAIVLNQEIRIQ